MPLIKAGKLRAIVQTGAERWFELPDVPTLGQAGVHDAESETLQILVAPKNTPPAIANRLGDAVVKVLKDPKIRENLLKTGFAVAGTGPADLKKRIAEEVAKWRDVIASAKLKVN
jgi:tripartite-type tricarboxylate transporter receptor subunit TctC